MPRLAWSLADELATLTRAVETARRVADAQPADATDPRDLTAILEAVVGSLGLVECRLRDLSRVARGELDPALLRAQHNAVELDAADDASDIVFRAWGPKGRAAHARRELARAEADAARSRS